MPFRLRRKEARRNIKFIVGTLFRTPVAAAYGSPRMPIHEFQKFLAEMNESLRGPAVLICDLNERDN